MDMYSVCVAKHLLERGVIGSHILEEPLLGELLLGQGLCEGLDVSLHEVVVLGLHLLVGGEHSVTTNPRGSRRAAGPAGD